MWFLHLGLFRVRGQLVDARVAAARQGAIDWHHSDATRRKSPPMHWKLKHLMGVRVYVCESAIVCVRVFASVSNDVGGPLSPM